MRISHDELKTFYWVAKLGSFNAAARHLNRTQPTISQRIANFERNLSKELFDRSEYKASLTKEGMKVLRKVEQILFLLEDMGSNTFENDPLQGIFRFGIANVFAYTYLSEILAFLKKKHPNMQVELTVNYSQLIWNALVNRDLDIGIITNIQSNNEIICRPLTDIKLSWVCGKDNDLYSSQISLTPNHLYKLPIITTPSPSHLHNSIISWFEKKSLIPTEIHTCNSLYSILTLVSNNIGISIVPDLLLSMVGAPEVHVLKTRPMIPPHKLFLAYQKDLDGDVINALFSITKKSIEDRNERLAQDSLDMR